MGYEQMLETCGFKTSCMGELRSRSYRTRNAWPLGHGILPDRPLRGKDGNGP